MVYSMRASDERLDRVRRVKGPVSRRRPLLCRRRDSLLTSEDGCPPRRVESYSSRPAIMHCYSSDPTASFPLNSLWFANKPKPPLPLKKNLHCT